MNERMSTKIFIAYASEDIEYREEFQKEFGIHSTGKHWETWSDEGIPTGTSWHDYIQSKIKDSNAVILLISHYFLASNYIKEHEFANFIKKNKLESVLIFPVLLSECDVTKWDDLNKLQFFKPLGKDYNVIDYDKKIVPFLMIKEVAYKRKYFKECVEQFEKCLQEIKKPLTMQSKILTTSETAININRQNYTEHLEEYWKIIDHRTLDPEEQREIIDKALKLEKKITEVLFGDFREKLDGEYRLSFAENLFDELIRARLVDNDLEKSIKGFQNKITSKETEKKDNVELTLIISGLTISFLKHPDRKKLSLLIDFVTEFKDQIWQKALIGIAFGIIKYGKKITSFKDITDRLNALKTIPSIQDTIFIIESILKTKRYYRTNIFDINPLDFDLSDVLYLMDSDWFRPFIFTDKMKEILIGEIDANINIEDFGKLLENSTLADIHKKYICKHIGKFSNKYINAIYTSLEQEAIDLPTFSNLDILVCNYLRDIICFCQFKHIKVFDRCQSLYSETILEIASEKTVTKISASTYIDDKKYEKSLELLSKYDNSECDIGVYNMIAICYFELEMFDDLFSLSFDVLQKIDENQSFPEGIKEIWYRYINCSVATLFMNGNDNSNYIQYYWSFIEKEKNMWLRYLEDESFLKQSINTKLDDLNKFRKILEEYIDVMLFAGKVLEAHNICDLTKEKKLYFPNYIYLKSKCFFDEKKYLECILIYENKLTYNDAPVWVFISESLSMLGNYIEALECVKFAIKLYPDYEYFDECRKAIQDQKNESNPDFSLSKISPQIYEKFNTMKLFLDNYQDYIVKKYDFPINMFSKEKIYFQFAYIVKDDMTYLSDQGHTRLYYKDVMDWENGYIRYDVDRVTDYFGILKIYDQFMVCLNGKEINEAKLLLLQCMSFIQLLPAVHYYIHDLDYPEVFSIQDGVNNYISSIPAREIVLPAKHTNEKDMVFHLMSVDGKFYLTDLGNTYQILNNDYYLLNSIIQKYINAIMLCFTVKQKGFEFIFKIPLDKDSEQPTENDIEIATLNLFLCISFMENMKIISIDKAKLL